METKPTDAEFVALVLEKTKNGALKWEPLENLGIAYQTFVALPTGQSLWLIRNLDGRRVTFSALALRSSSGHTSFKITSSDTVTLDDLWDACKAQQGTEVEKAMQALNSLPYSRPHARRGRVAL